MASGEHRVGWLVVILLASTLAGCTGDTGPQGPFTEVGDAAGFSYRIDLGLPPNAHPMAFLGGGVAVGDVNGDHWPDVYVADRNQNALYINNGDGTFSDRTRQWDAWDAGVGRAPVLFDYDNDGDLDLFVGNFVSQSRLYRNDGDRFTNVTDEAGVGVRSTVMNVATGDVNGNGYLDLFLGTYGDLAKNQPETMTTSENGEANWLFLNNGDGTFTDATRQMNLTLERWTLASAFVDFDRDGDLDLYVANDFGWDSLYINEGDRFVERGRQLDAVVNRNGMGVTWFDPDLDGDLDVYVTNIYVEGSGVPLFEGNALFLNEGGAFREVSREAGVADGAWSWDAEAADLNNDGAQDLYVANGFASRGDFDMYYDVGYQLEEGRPGGPTSGGGYGLVRGRYNATHTMTIVQDSVPPGFDLRDPQTVRAVSQGGYQTSRLFVNDGTGGFEERAEVLNAGTTGDSRAVARLDFDRDGDLDLLVTEARGNVRLLRNNWADGHWFQAELDPGPGRFADAIGAWVEVTTANGTQVRVMEGASGFMSQAEPLIHVGLGEATEVEEVVVIWPWGEQTRYTDLPADQRYLLEPGGGASPVPR